MESQMKRVQINNNLKTQKQEDNNENPTTKKVITAFI